MAAQDPILVGLSGATWTMTAESGGAIQSYSRDTERKFNFVYDAGVGYTTGFVAHDPKATYSIELICEHYVRQRRFFGRGVLPEHKPEALCGRFPQVHRFSLPVSRTRLKGLGPILRYPMFIQCPKKL